MEAAEAQLEAALEAQQQATARYEEAPLRRCGVAATGEGAKDGKMTAEWWVDGLFMEFLW